MYCYSTINVSTLDGCSSVHDQLKTVSQSIDFNDLRYKNAYLILSERFCYILPNLNEFVLGKTSPIPTYTIEISLS